MYHIDSTKDKPDIGYMATRIRELMDEGIRLGDIDDLYEKFLGIQKELGDSITEKYGIQNPNSGPQVIEYMKDLDNMEVYEICYEGGKWSSRKDNLQELSDLGYQFAKDLLDYRSAKKCAESINSMIKARHPDGMVRPTVSLGKTNRINYSEPAIMNIPKHLLWYTVVPRGEGNSLYSVDIKNQEPSILINLLNIEELKDALVAGEGLYENLFKKPFVQRTRVTIYVTRDEERRIVPAEEMVDSETIPPVYYTPIKPTVDTIYYNDEKVKLIEVCNTITTVGVEPLLPATVNVETVEGNIYEVEVEWDGLSANKLSKVGMAELEGTLKGLDIRCEGVYRSEFKQAWNAMTYGASRAGIKRMCKHIDGDKVYDYFSKIPQFKEYKSNCNKLVRRGIQAINTFFGTRLYADVEGQARLRRVLMDLPIQGTGADILSLLIKHLDNEIEVRGLKGKIGLYYTRHDEIIIEVDKQWEEEVGKQYVVETLKDILEHQIDDWIPFKVEVERVEVEPINIGETDFDVLFA